MKTLLTATLLALALPALAQAPQAPCPCAAQGPDRAISKSVRVKASPEEVYRSWTTAEGITGFFAPGAVVEPRVDGAFDIHMNPYAAPGLKGADGMRFLALQENRMVSFTWNAPPHLPEARAQRTVVTVRMRPAGPGETDVTLTHGHWGEGGEWDKAYAYFDRAWGNVLANLQKRHAEGKPFDWAPWLEKMKAAEAARK